MMLRSWSTSLLSLLLVVALLLVAAPVWASPALPYTPVVTPNGSTLSFTMEDGVKVFHLISEPVKREFAPGLVVNAWGYNGQSPGPTIEAVEGDRIRILLTNKLPEATSLHLHGVLLPNGMDGVAGLNQPHIQPGETYAYELTLRQHGTQMYHPHSDEMTEMAFGMMGFFIIHPKKEPQRIDRDFAIFLHEWNVPPGGATPNPATMTDFNLFTFNGRVYPGTAPLVVRKGQRVRIRFANLSMDSHPIHLHGYHFVVTGTDGGPVPPGARIPETTVNCHKSHHTMNQMSHDVPNMTGVDQSDVEERVRKLLPGYMAMGQNGMGDMESMHMGGPKNTIPMMSGEGPYGPIGMGGMFTVLKVRAGITTYEDPGWYDQPDGTTAHRVELPAPAAER
jgi:FtsP/CotA-like multicopper oxidase with cupredoxin domain